MGEWTSGRGDREEGTGDAVERCKGAKVERWARAKLASGLVVGWASGMGGRGRGRRQCEGAKVQRWRPGGTHKR